MLNPLHHLLASPKVYTLIQSLFAPGAEKRILDQLMILVKSLPKHGQILDLGCGPNSWLWKLDWQPVGLDLSYPYARSFKKQGRWAVTGSCCALPFADQSYNGVWSIGVLHHLNDTDANQTISEMLRICKPDGYVAIMDAVLPRSVHSKPVPYLIRKLDRGAYMRTQEQLEAILPVSLPRTTKRYTYAYTGLEMFEVVCRPNLQELKDGC